MLEAAFNEVYTKFKLHFYQQVFRRIGSSGASLTPVECLCMDGIAALGEPTVAEFAQFMNISNPNATYKVNSLVQKGYVEKIRSNEDRREYHLRPTEQYHLYAGATNEYQNRVLNRIKENFSVEDVEKLDQLLSVVGSKLMTEEDAS